MKKRTHLLVSKFFTRDLDLLLCNRFWLYLGSIAPDLTPMCLLRPHRFSSRSSNITERFYSLDFNSKDWLFYFRVGVISHFVADFFTAPHNREGLKGFCVRHRGYENDLDKFFRDNLSYFKFSKVSNFSFENYLNSLHDDYMSTDTSIEVDFGYICTIVNSVLSYSCSKELSYRGVA